ncbi:hypothetical protein CCAX7_26350 [Capsulimonas corticalis]|uniref:Uncharacterized protein n=1 Tax=Capsulimonas corticalis TaxID=2219043 RepID=A0A402D6K2_9BACT|nr:hypothetical protein [Capsulimonas corticalis]BDI30584.1 hypothetical protein CCAX7_26350 [Capsulimonas corticalis]
MEDRYIANDFVNWANRIENLNPDDCHADFYAARIAIAASIRRMAAEPQNVEHVRAINGLRLFIYV